MGVPVGINMEQDLQGLLKDFNKVKLDSGIELGIALSYLVSNKWNDNLSLDRTFVKVDY